MKRDQRYNSTKLNAAIPVMAKGKSSQVNTAASAMTREDAGVDCDSPWVASCDKHGEMLGCDTKRNAMYSARHSDEWCSGCQKAMTQEQVQAKLDELGIDIRPALERVKRLIAEKRATQ